MQILHKPLRPSEIHCTRVVYRQKREPEETIEIA
jgi:hypothetical protein